MMAHRFCMLFFCRNRGKDQEGALESERTNDIAWVLSHLNLQSKIFLKKWQFSYIFESDKLLTWNFENNDTPLNVIGKCYYVVAFDKTMLCSQQYNICWNHFLVHIGSWEQCIILLQIVNCLFPYVLWISTQFCMYL